MKFIEFAATSLAAIGLCQLANSTPISAVPSPSNIGVVDGKRYLLFHKDLVMSHTVGVERCASLNGSLAEITSSNIVTLSSLLAKVESKPTYIASWNGDSYNNQCIALFPGTFTITTPAGGCAGPLPVLCQFKASM